MKLEKEERSGGVIPIVVFAQTPPPEHGQSRMVLRAIEALSEASGEFEVHHVDSRFSETLDDIGESSFVKGLLIGRYLLAAVTTRLSLKSPLLYYVPGPVKRSSLIRDWILLGVLRLFYRKVVFHWHAIGQGEWAHGSERLSLSGPKWIDRAGRFFSRIVLSKPYASICVVETSAKDAEAIGSRKTITVYNGIEDPCPDFDQTIMVGREKRLQRLVTDDQPCFRLLFLSHGTIEKGLFDALDSVGHLLESSPSDWRFRFTIAGGVKENLKSRFDEAVANLESLNGDRLSIHVRGYVQGEEKQICYGESDIFIAPSRWESFGLTVAEAMANGLQVVAVASDGVSGVLPCRYGFLSPVADTFSLAENLRFCCESLVRGEGGEVARDLRDRFTKLFRIEDFKGSLVRCFRSLKCGQSVGGVGALRERSFGGQLPENKLGRGGAVAKSPNRRTNPVLVTVYLADQSPKLGRSLGISRMTQVVLGEMARREGIELTGIRSRSSIKMPPGTKSIIVPWSTRGRMSRVLTDHLHPLMRLRTRPDLWYFPKGFLPRVSAVDAPMVVTIHDTIIQYYSDHYPKWRMDVEYHYWASILKNTLRRAKAILTVSESAKGQIVSFMERHDIPPKEVVVTYEPCLYEALEQPTDPAKADYVLHLASREPHKRTSWLIELWAKAHGEGRRVPRLHVVGKVPYDVVALAEQSPAVIRLPFLDDDALVSQFTAARALLLPSEIEGFGLPAIEAYYLGTPVCYVTGTSVEEVLAPATSKGGFHYGDEGSIFRALDEVMSLSAGEVRECGLKLRREYAADRVVDKILEVFKQVGGKD